MIILLDFDGVLITTPGWKPVEQHADGFLKFNPVATRNLIRLTEATLAAFVLTTTHRISYSASEWQAIFNGRGIFPSAISKINAAASVAEVSGRASEIAAWVATQVAGINYVVLDDDLSLNGLPEFIKRRCVLTKPLIGLDADSTEKALSLLQDYSA
ncbi:MAG: HAD domain-containing protein [Bacteroidota bacterium]|nr:HAD domain-containing protein [Bacteroidota bacterium]